MKQKIIILGSVSFVLDSARVGINWIAKFLAQEGYDVTYVSSASTPLDILFSRKRARFKAAWLHGGKFKVATNLTEIIFKSPWLLNRLRSVFGHKSAGIFQRDLLSQKYTVLIATVGALSIFADKIHAPLKILRLQDDLLDFGMSKYVINNLKLLLAKQTFHQIWPVSQYLWNYANQFQPDKNILLSNGVHLPQFINYYNKPKTKKVIYVGAFNSWVDSELIIKSALLLPDWHFDLFGSDFNLEQELPKNVTYEGAIDSLMLPELLSHYCVGLIPFINCTHILAVERPLKFYQYLSVGLGVASTDYGGLRGGMGQLASYGNSPQEFAAAIVNAFEQSQNRSKEEIQQYLENFNWNSILPQMLYHIKTGIT
jgi:glycosyltransferase involved in cell wall biosynthesis